MGKIQKPKNFTIRINRFLADAGLGSRRGAEEIIRAGRVSINGQLTTQLGLRVVPGTDEVMVDGQIVHAQKAGVVYAFHKPLGVVCTLKGQGGQPTLLPYKNQAELANPIMPVGRLDSDSSGLLLWTDDGNLNQALCRPGSGVWKKYRVRLSKALSSADRLRFSGGNLELDGRPCLPCELERADNQEHVWLVSLHEGRRRQIRRMFRALGHKVLDLHRLAVGPVLLGKLKPGDFRRVPHQEIGALRSAATHKIPKQ